MYWFILLLFLSGNWFYIQLNFILKVYSLPFCFHQQNSFFRIENLSEMFDRDIESFDQKFFPHKFLGRNSSWLMWWTLQVKFENNRSYGELVVSTATFNKNIFTHFLGHYIAKIQFSKISLFPKPVFIPKYFTNKLIKARFGGHCLMIWLNGSFFMLSCSKTSLVEKTSTFEWTLDYIRIEKIISVPVWATKPFSGGFSSIRC